MSQTPTNHQNSGDEKKYWLDQPNNIRLIVWALVAVCIGLVIFDFFYHKHGHFKFEYWPAFYAWYGFLSYCTIVLTAKQLRKVLKRDETYYEPEDPDTNNEMDAQPTGNSSKEGAQ